MPIRFDAYERVAALVFVGLAGCTTADALEASRDAANAGDIGARNVATNDGESGGGYATKGDDARAGDGASELAVDSAAETLAPDGESPDADDADSDAGDCTRPLDASGCPGTYGVAVSECGGADGGAPTLSGAPTAVTRCEGLAAVVLGGGAHGAVCFYDGVDAGILIGAEAWTDGPTGFCGPTAQTVTSGQVPASCQFPWAWRLPVNPFSSCEFLDAGTDALSDGSGATPD